VRKNKGEKKKRILQKKDERSKDKGAKNARTRNE
jgi:hypothetical protein